MDYSAGHDAQNAVSTADEDTRGSFTGGKSQIPRRRRRRRLATVYDAVAGRIYKDHALPNEDIVGQGPSNQRSRAAPRGNVISPDEVLFRRKDAPVRFAEHDVYNAHERDLPDYGRDVLPDSHLLKSIHAYSSRFYSAMERGRRGRHGIGRAVSSIDEQSMDETALLAFGILLEEAGREILGRRGDLVFTEGLVESNAPTGEDEGARNEPFPTGNR